MNMKYDNPDDCTEIVGADIIDDWGRVVGTSDDTDDD